MQAMSNGSYGDTFGEARRHKVRARARFLPGRSYLICRKRTNIPVNIRPVSDSTHAVLESYRGQGP